MAQLCYITQNGKTKKDLKSETQGNFLKPLVADNKEGNNGQDTFLSTGVWPGGEDKEGGGHFDDS